MVMRYRTKKGPEQIEQEAIASYLSLALPPGVFWTAVDNARSSKAEAGQRKAMGVRAGLPDIWVLMRAPAGLTRVACFELKRRRARSITTGKVIAAGTPSLAQLACHADLENAGARVWVVYSLDDIIRILREEYGLRLYAARLSSGAILSIPEVS